VLRHTAASGPLAVQLDLGVDLRDARDTQASGTLESSGLTLQVKGLKQPLQAVTGKLHFDGNAVQAQGLQARWYGTGLTADIAPDGDGDLLTGEFDLDPSRDALAAAFVPDWLRATLRGAAAGGCACRWAAATAAS
jgi:Predicted membrane protein